MKLQVLVTTMKQVDLSKFYAMNIQSDVFFANQSDNYSYIEKKIDDITIKMLTTRTKGLSKNRNIALACTNLNAEYILFSDDDLTFYDGYENLILNEFIKNPKADAIRFNLKTASTSKRSVRQIHCLKKATPWNSGFSGVCGMCIKQSILQKKNLHFNELFGPGTEFYCGEDTIFIKEMLKKDINLYFSPVTIGEIDQSESTWYEGQTEKYFQIKGMVLQVCFPFLAKFIIFLQAYRFYKRGTPFSFWKILKNLHIGIQKYKKLK